VTSTTISPLKLHSLGYSPIPIGLNKKALVKWGKFQTRQVTTDELAQFEAMNPPAWAILTGEFYNLLVIDLDINKEEPEKVALFERNRSIMEAHGLTQHTLTPRRGLHYYSSYPKGVNITVAAGELPGVDWRGTGGYVGVIGTVYLDKDYPEKGTGEYQLQILPTPDTLIPWEKLPQPLKIAMTTSTPTKTPARGCGNGHGEAGAIPEHQRHARLVSLAGAMRRQGATEDAIRAAIMVTPLEGEFPDEEREEIARDITRRYQPAALGRELHHGQAFEPPQVFNANAEPTRKDVPNLFEIEHRGKMLPGKQHTTLFSQGGAGKSLTGADYIPILFSNGIAAPPFIPLGQGNVLVCDWETELETHRRYITAIKKSIRERSYADLDAGIIHYIQFTEPITTHADFIRDFIRGNDVQLVVIDSQIAAMAGAFPSLKDEQLAGVYYNILTSWQVTTLTIDHVPKSNMNNDSSTGAAFGSVVKYNRARSVFEMKQAQEPGENFIELAFVHQKNNLGPKLKPFGLRIQFDNDEEGNLDRVSFEPLDLSNSSKLEKVRPTWERARDAIIWTFNGRASVKQLAEELGTTKGTVRDCLNRYKEVFTKVGVDRDGAIWGVKQRSA